MNRIPFLLAVPLIVAAITLFVSCGNREIESENTEIEEDVANNISSGEAWRNSEPYQKLTEALQQRAISPARIREEHEKRFLNPIPSYAENIRGIIGERRSSGKYPAYVFEVPAENVADFDEYLVEIGVPREYLSKDVVFYNALTHQIPHTAKEELQFCETHRLHPTEGEVMGIHLNPKDEWIGYFFVKKWRDCYFSIKYSRDTGEVRVSEKSSDEDD